MLPRTPNKPHAKMQVMSLKISTDPAPLFTDEDGVVRVGGTRVRLETVVYAFNQGASAEEILQQYPFAGTRRHLRNDQLLLTAPNSVDDYLKERQQGHDRLRQLTNRGPIQRVCVSAS